MPLKTQVLDRYWGLISDKNKMYYSKLKKKLNLRAKENHPRARCLQMLVCGPGACSPEAG